MLDQLVMGYASQMSGQKAAFVTLNHIQTIDCNMRRAKAACGHPVRHGWRRQALLPDPAAGLSQPDPLLHIAASQGCLVDLGK
ncbi:MULTISPECIES: hypothetical protein [Aeromonas]|uniref:Uncharacterized protein n=1 Tax=Aeromonas media TaxID=651 RepID=A0A6M4ZD99_AERME|nr:hypothetical protein [Aeromonas media]MBP6071896.1 hypothetical protein [Aeromonas sp.]MBP8080077.1 hypothetical protein [Aeromonas sp.]MBP8112779.1 hypothetical protein [Aeromonas sp.]MBP8189917.1 hypothetical protein [Aeromonas sp.]MBP9678627.1 hypothetical protein [Aeromonas sp.]